MSERLDTARRLELSGVTETGGVVEGTYRGVKVTLEDHGLERTLTFDVGLPVRWVRIGPHEDLNDPDVVQTGDSDFDLAITVLAEDGAEPTVRGVFDTTAVRDAVRAFFQRYPNAGFRGRTLTVPRVAAQNAETSALLDGASRLILGLREAIAASPVRPTEAPPQIQTHVTERAEDRIEPLGFDPAPFREDRSQYVVWAGLIAGGGSLALLPPSYWALSLAVGILAGGIVYVLSRSRW